MAAALGNAGSIFAKQFGNPEATRRNLPRPQVYPNLKLLKKALSNANKLCTINTGVLNTLDQLRDLE
jgi:hypothetical protein